MTRYKRRKKSARSMITFALAVAFTLAALLWIRFWSEKKAAKSDTEANDYTLEWTDDAGNDRGDSDFTEIEDELPANLQRLYEKNEDAREFVLHYREYKDMDFDIDLSQYKNAESVPLLMQWDKRWGYKQYAGDLFGLTGCGPTCLSMVAIYVTGDTKYTPDYMRTFASDNGYYEEGNGTKWTLFSEGAAQLGMDVTEIPLVESRINANLEVGNPVVCIMGPGHFTESGHYIVLTGIKDGEYTVNDPNSFVNSEKTWSYSDIEGEIRNLWVIR